MPGTICSVSTCKSNREKAKKEGKVIRFFTFPKNEDIRKEWVRVCNKGDKFDALNKRICSKHFELNQYEDYIQARLTNILPRRLKETAIPTLCLPNKPEKGATVRSKRLKIKERKETAIKLSLKSSKDDIPLTSDLIKNNPTTSTCKHSSYDILFEKYNSLQKENEALKNKLSKNKSDFEILEKKYKKLQSLIDQSKNSCLSKKRKIDIGQV